MRLKGQTKTKRIDLKFREGERETRSIPREATLDPLARVINEVF